MTNTIKTEKPLFSVKSVLGKTMGQLIRYAIKKTYKQDANKDQQQPNQKQKTQIMQGWKLLKNPSQPLNYRQLIQDGRKY